MLRQEQSVLPKTFNSILVNKVIIAMISCLSILAINRLRLWGAVWKKIIYYVTPRFKLNYNKICPKYVGNFRLNQIRQNTV